MMSILTLLGWPFVLAGLLLPFLLWMFVGLRWPQGNAEERDGWLRAGTVAELIVVILYVFYNVPGLR